MFQPSQNASWTPPPPIFNPYHHLFYANGYTHAYETTEPFRPQSLPQVGIFFPNITASASANSFVGSMLPGEIGAGPRADMDQYWFNAFGAYFGCDNSGPDGCIMKITGYIFDATGHREVIKVEQLATIPSCPGLHNCTMTSVTFDNNFRALSGIQFESTDNTRQGPQVFIMDSLRMGWYNNTCAAGLMRITNRK